MHEIDISEVSEEFTRCWNSAGLHIQNQAQGQINSWLRSHLIPPFLDHLSFRIGNQLFYIRVEDVDGNLLAPGNPEGLLAIADGCEGHACVMPMRKVGVDWIPQETGWGLLDARNRQLINPLALISDEKILMTDWELHDFAVQVVRDHLVKDGKKLLSWNGDPRVTPSLWFVGESGQEWVVVRAARYPDKEAVLPDNIDEIKSYFKKLGHRGHYGLVCVASADDPFDPMAKKNRNFFPLYRGHGMMVIYKGLQSIR